MRNIFNIFFCASLLALGVAACNKPQPDEGDGTQQIPDTNGNQGNQSGNTDAPQLFEFPYVAEFPIDCGNLMAEGSDVGVTIEVTRVEDNNFVFELRPGAMVQSFKFDVYPLAQLYNNLLNDKTYGYLKDSESWAVNERIREYLFNESGSGGYAISITDSRFEENPEEFLQIEFDWMNTSYAAASAIAIPDCDYIIAVVGATDTEISSSNQEDLTLCYVHTTSQPLIGDPQCEIEVITSYRAFAVNHIPNADAKGVYFFGYLSSEIDAYIDTFGDTMFRDFMRTRLTSPSDVSNPDALTYSLNYGEAADATIQSTTCVVAVDENLTPQEGYTRRDFTLDEMPPEVEQPVAEVEVKIVHDRVAASYVEFDLCMTAECKTIFWRFYTPEEMETFVNGSSKDRKKEAIDMATNGGYGCHNPNFAWDPDGGEDGKGAATGSHAIVRDNAYSSFCPGSTYYIGYTGRNGYGTMAELKFSEPIVFDERNLVSPDECKVKDLKLVLDNPGRTSFRATVTYDPATVSMIYLQYMTKDQNPGLWTDSSWSDWMGYIFAQSSTMGGVMYSNVDVNGWCTLPSGKDGFTWFGMTPDTEYTMFLCAEDFDGNVSALQFDSISTIAVQVGEDPTMVMTLEPEDSYPYDWTVSYKIDHDVKYFKYAYTDNVADLSSYISGLTQSKLNDIANSGISYEDWYNGIYEWVIELGMETEADTSQSWDEDTTGDVVIAACVAVGEDADGQPVYNLFHLICKDGKAQTLEEIFNITK